MAVLLGCDQRFGVLIQGRGSIAQADIRGREIFVTVECDVCNGEVILSR
jgi:hypothetical protein